MSEQIPQNRFYEPTVEKREVPRYDREIGFIGDTNGDFRGYLKNLLSLGFVEIHLRDELLNIHTVVEKTAEEIAHNAEFVWKGGNAKLFVMGDILDDRQGEGDMILNSIDILCGLAREQGGDVIVLFGNHDAEAVRYLALGTNKECEFSSCPLLEYQRFSSETGEVDELGDAIIGFDRRVQYQDPNFVKHIRQIKRNYTLPVVENETLILHPDVSERMFTRLVLQYEGRRLGVMPGFVKRPAPALAETVVRMREDFSTLLGDLFPEEDDAIRILEEDELQKCVDAFFAEDGIVETLSGANGVRALGSTRGGEYPSEYKTYSREFIEFLKARGIKRILFGHTPNALQIYDDFQVIGSDGKSRHNNQKFSAGIIGKDGSVESNITPRQPVDAELEKNRIKEMVEARRQKVEALKNRNNPVK